LFAALLCLVLVYPYAEQYVPDFRLNLFVRLAVLGGAVRALDQRQPVRWAMAALAAAPLPGALFPELGPAWLPLASLVCEILFYASMVGLLTVAVFHRPDVSRETLYGAASTYLMIALAFGVAYQIAELTTPGSFQLPEWVSPASLERALFYFSFVTLTTLGYGDITPVSDAVRSLVVIQSVAGVLFAAIMISRVVALYTSGDSELPFESPIRLRAQAGSGAPHFEVLFAAQLIQLASYPYAPVAVTSLVGVGILVAALASLRERRAHLMTGLALAVPAVAGLGLWESGSTGAVVGASFLTLFLAFASWALGAHVFSRRQVDREAIFGVCCVYLLIGAAFAGAYYVVLALDPGSVSHSGEWTALGSFAGTIYLSYVTLTTLGFGDILPLAGVAQSLATVESVMGVLFPAVLIARLVSLYRSTETSQT
jgi:hypothetical protein